MRQPSVLCMGGTTEGRLFCAGELPVIYSALTNLGDELVTPREGLKVRHGALPAEDMARLIHDEHVVAVVDATHPYAQRVSQTTQRVASALGVPYARLERQASGELEGNDVTYVRDEDEAASFVGMHQGVVFLTTGATRLMPYVDGGVIDRCWVRILPVDESREKARAAGIPPERTIAQMGPFTLEDNLAHFSQAKASFMITKDGGAVGGFTEKIEASRALGLHMVILKRPQETGETRFSTVEEAQAWAKSILERFDAS